MAENMRRHSPDSPHDATIAFGLEPPGPVRALEPKRPPRTIMRSSKRSTVAPSALATPMAAIESAHQVGLVMFEVPDAIAAQASARCIELFDAGAKTRPPTADGSA
jgi:hypothetical protein